MTVCTRDGRGFCTGKLSWLLESRREDLKTYNVLVVDDSAFVRITLKNLMHQDPRFNVVDTARNGLDAIEKIARLKPDLVTLDITMPEMDGLQALQKIMSSHPLPVVMLSSLTEEGTWATVEALQLGAVDFFPKTTLLQNLNNESVVREFFDKLEMATAAKVSPSPVPVLETDNTLKHMRFKNSVFKNPVKFILIGCSTGGPAALRATLPMFPEDFQVPILVCQHMPIGYTQQLSKSLDQVCPLKVKEVEDGEVIRPGNIYIAPSGYQTFVEKTPDKLNRFKVDRSASKYLYKPCIDLTLMSVVTAYEKNLLSVILTGMGKDGTDGCRFAKEHGGSVWTQLGDTCVVNGMPKSVVVAGYSDMEVELAQLHEHVARLPH